MAENRPRIKPLKNIDSVLSVDEIKADEKIVDIKVGVLHRSPYDHYEIHLDDPTLPDLILSIQNFGIQDPVIVRPHPENKNEYEIVSGKRRRFVCELIGIETVPCVVRDYTNEQVRSIIEDLNIKRGKITYKEKILSIKESYDNLKSQGKRTDLKSDELQEQIGENGFEKTTDISKDIASTARDKLRHR